MDKRFLSFLWAALLVVLLYSVGQQILLGPQRQAAVPPDGANQGQELADPADEVHAATDAAPDDVAREGARTDPQGSASSQAAPNKAVDAAGPKSIQPLSGESSERRFTLGSLDPASGHRLLVTFTNRGAAIERVELNRAQYTDVDDRSGYLGHLALEDAEGGGCRVRVVGAGTPASLATSPDANSPGLLGPRLVKDETADGPTSRPGDVIVSVNDEAVAGVEAFNRLMARTRPKQTIRLKVRRDFSPQPSKELDFQVKLRKRPLEVIQPEPHVIEDDRTEDPLSYRWTLFQVGEKKTGVSATELDRLPSLLEGLWEVTAPADPLAADAAIEFRARLTPDVLAELGVADADLELVKRFRLRPRKNDPPATGTDPRAAAEAYAITMELEIHNRGARPLPVAYSLEGPTGLPLEGWWYSYKVHPSRFGAAGIRDLLFRAVGQSHEMITCANITQHAQKNPESPRKPLLPAGKGAFALQYVGGDAQFFSAMLMPDPAEGAADPFASEKPYLFQQAEAVAAGELDLKLRKRTDVSFRLISETNELPPAGAIRHRFKIFTGPKDPELLDPLGLDECIVYGWFGRVARPMVWILHGLYRISGSLSYGLAIVLLTVLVRGAMYPLGRKMALNAQKMQELAPEIKKITDQYKDDMEKRAAAQRELFRKHKYNPLSGCLVMFIQLPVFVGLYRALSVDIKLRQAPLIPGVEWCSNLAGPDRLWHWEEILPPFITSPSGWMGPYLNILPFFSFALMMVHQKLFTPPPQDEQQKMQMQVMNFMMIFFAVMFHKIAAGLCIYFIVSSLWGLAERLLLGKYKPPAEKKAVPAFALTNGVDPRKRDKPRKS